MPPYFLDPNFQPTEHSAKLAFSGNHLDRQSEAREDDCVDRAMEHSDAQFIGIARGRVVLRFNGEDAIGFHPHDHLSDHQPRWERAILLGYENGAPRLAVPLGLNPDDENLVLPDDVKLVDFRSLAIQKLLSHSELGQMAQGAATLAWHSSARYCGRCGGQTEMKGGGVKRHCQSCKADQFPRTDPVVIMLTVRGDKCLLGRSPHFPPGMYSALAGFVEAGETMETAVRRETHEESGIHIGRVRYHATQPWPFPHTLMIGCYGEALSDEIVRDEGELDDCRWFTRDEILAILDGNGPLTEDDVPQFFTPPNIAIASRLVTDWARNGEGQFD
ncbi:MAG: NAD(+) diphosphatase [Pseudomonadota bacterium]